VSVAERRTTLATVAASAGVSVATVSKVLNGRSDVAPATRARVKELLRTHDYAGHLVGLERRPTVELTLQGQLLAYSAEVIQGVSTAAAELGAAVTVSVLPRQRPQPSRAGAARWARDLVANGRRAVIAVTEELSVEEITALRVVGLPLVVIDPVNLPSEVPSVGATNFRGGLEAARHLLDLGHRRIAYLGGPAASECNQARRQGFLAAMAAVAEEVPDEYLLSSADFCYEDGVVGGSRLLDLPTRPTAIFAGNDELAAGVLEAARGRGILVPQDLSVVGFDDTQVARIASPPLTTVRQPLQDMGAVAIRTALMLAADEKIDSQHVELATKLVIRSSTAPLRDSEGESTLSG
jgi:LacI family transcriptional regulator, galactose operon repressor